MAEILIADMRRVQPREALSERPDVGHWFVCPYSAAYMPICITDGCRRRRFGSVSSNITMPVDGISFWDTYARMWRKSEWLMIRIAGHREELGDWAKRASSFWRKVPMESICGTFCHLGSEVVA